jgi:hypothetical protein
MPSVPPYRNRRGRHPLESAAAIYASRRPGASVGHANTGGCWLEILPMSTPLRTRYQHITGGLFMKNNAILLTAKVIESHLRQQFKDIEKYLDFFDKSIELEKDLAVKSSSKIDDEMLRHIARYQSHISFPAIHNKALLIFMHSSFERLFCWTACWIAIGEDGGSKIESLKGFPDSKRYIERILANGELFQSTEWKSVDELRLVRNHLAHGGSENIIGVPDESKYLSAAKEINGKFDGAFEIGESDGNFIIEPNQNTVRVAMACYKAFLFLLVSTVKAEGTTKV